MGHVCSHWLQHVDQTIKQKVKTTSLCVTCYPVSAAKAFTYYLQCYRERDTRLKLLMSSVQIPTGTLWFGINTHCISNFSGMHAITHFPFRVQNFFSTSRNFTPSCCPGIFRDVNFSITDLKMEPDNCLAFWKSKLSGKLRNTG